MAHRIGNRLLARKRAYTAIKGSWQANGASEVSAILGQGFTVSRTGVGEYTVTLDTAFPEMISGRANVQRSSAAAHNAQLGIFSPTARTLIIRVLDNAGAGVDSVSNRVQFRATFFNGTNGP